MLIMFCNTKCNLKFTYWLLVGSRQEVLAARPRDPTPHPLSLPLELWRLLPPPSRLTTKMRTWHPTFAFIWDRTKWKSVMEANIPGQVQIIIFTSTFLASTSAVFHLVAVSTIENNYVIMLSGQPQSLGILLIFLRPWSGRILQRQRNRDLYSCFTPRWNRNTNINQ